MQPLAQIRPYKNHVLRKQGSGLAHAIEADLQHLSPKMRDLGRYCLDNLRELHRMRIQHLADQSGNIPSTVVRFAKRYGYAGFQDFKFAFLQDGVQDTFTHPFDNRELPTNALPMIHHIEASLQEAHAALTNLLQNKQAMQDVARAAELIIQSFEAKGRVFSAGNGGSMCDAMHFAEELTGRYRLDRPALAATAISDASHMSCVGNDLGYEQIFSRYLEAHGREGDCFLAITTSGTSKNIVRAVHAAKAQGMKVIALTGRRNPDLEALSDVYVCTTGGQFADRVQELHIKVLHILIELIERHFFPANYAG